MTIAARPGGELRGGEGPSAGGLTVEEVAEPWHLHT